MDRKGKRRKGRGRKGREESGGNGREERPLRTGATLGLAKPKAGSGCC